MFPPVPSVDGVDGVFPRVPVPSVDGISVSYTHLDVYKRQDEGSAAVSRIDSRVCLD